TSGRRPWSAPASGRRSNEDSSPLSPTLPREGGGRIVKKLINQVDDIVVEALQGMAAAHPDLVEINLEPRYVVRRGAPASGTLALVSGGGSGHEPMHGGFV